jgi:hypothetical protein
LRILVPPRLLNLPCTRAPRVARLHYKRSKKKPHDYFFSTATRPPIPSLPRPYLSLSPPVRSIEAPFRAQVRGRRPIPARRELVEPRLGRGTCECRGLPSHSAFASRQCPIDLVSTAAAILLPRQTASEATPSSLVDSYDAAGKEIGNGRVPFLRDPCSTGCSLGWALQFMTI